MKKLLLLSAALFIGLVSTLAQNVTVNPGAGSYATIKGAFDAINAGTHTGAITISIVNNTTETATASLNASGSGSASYTSITISPSGGAARTVSGAITAGSPLIDFNGANNVTIDGLNTGGNSLTISNTTVSTTSGTCTVRFIGGATNNTITNCTVLGAFNSTTITTNGGTIFFSTDVVTANGNDNNTISNSRIGPVGTSLPVKAIYGNGSTSTTALGNSGILIHNNDFYDFFLPNGTSAGIYTNSGCNTWTISNNRFYQTSSRTFSGASTHTPININGTTATQGAQGFTITGNTIGYSANNQTGVYEMTGSTGKFIGIRYNGIPTGNLTTISSNTIASVSLTGVTSNGTTTSSPFSGIMIVSGLVETNNNTIGSQSATGSLTYSTNTTSGTDVNGIIISTSSNHDNFTANGNNIGGITFTNSGTSGSYSFYIYGLRASTANANTFNASNNIIGGTVSNSIQLNTNGTGSQLIGIATTTPAATLTSNTVRNLTNNNGTGSGASASVIGLLSTTTGANHTFSQNTIYNLNNTDGSGASNVTGIQFTGSTANVVERNLIYGLTVATNSSSAAVNGIRVEGGTTTYRNNVIAIGEGISNAIGSNTGITGLNGIRDASISTSDNFFHNSVYIGGAATAGTGSSHAFVSSVSTGTKSFRNNIFFNARTNSGATGKHHAIRLGNPSALTINNNVYFANGSGAVFGIFNSIERTDLTAWKSATGQDGASSESNPQYIAPTNTPPNLRPTTGNYFEGADLGVTKDYYDDTRSGTFDIGAYQRGAAGYWIGIASSDWATATNWDAGALPTGADNVAIRSSAVNMPQVTQDPASPAVCNNLTIGAGQSLTVKAGKALTVNGTFTNNAGVSGLVIESGGSLIHSTSEVPGTVERSIAAADWGTNDDGWHFISSPVAAQSISGSWTPSGGSGDYDFYAWSEATNTWLNQKVGANNITAFEVGKGYIVAYEQTATRTFSGNLNAANTTLSNLSYNASQGKGWHLLGNPFASAIKWNDGNWALSNVAGTAKIWNESTRAYTDLLANAYIPANNGFMVQVSGGTNSVTIPTLSREHNATAFYKSTEVFNGIKLVAAPSDKSAAQEIMIRTEAQASNGFDFYFDSRFIAGGAPQFYSVVDNELLSTNTLSNICPEMTINLGFVMKSHEVNTITLAENSLSNEVYLTDLKLNVTQKLSEVPTYTFTSSQGDNPNRFQLKFGAVGTGETMPAVAMSAYVYDNALYLLNASGKVQVEVLDLSGRLLLSKSLQADVRSSCPIKLPAGVYVVRMNDGLSINANKVIVK